MAIGNKNIERMLRATFCSCHKPVCAGIVDGICSDNEVSECKRKLLFALTCIRDEVYSRCDSMKPLKYEEPENLRGAVTQIEVDQDYMKGMFNE